MDEFEMIAKSFRGIEVTRNRFEAATIVYGCWLVDEVERLRKIEDAARVLTEGDHSENAQAKIQSLGAALSQNPRPEEPQ